MQIFNELERERERQRTDRQTEIDRQRDRQTERQADRETETESEWFIDKGHGTMPIVMKNIVKQLQTNVKLGTTSVQTKRERDQFIN